MGLAAQLREGSRDEHEAAERTPFVADLLAGRVSPATYAAYLGRLHGVYDALERVVRETADDPLVAALHDPDLERRGALEDDLTHWGGSPAARTPAVVAYAERLGAAGGWGGLVVAHHYTRYLGDLAGGQAVAVALARQHGLERGGPGLRFYAFDRLRAGAKAYRDAYRARLDTLALAPADRTRVLAEVRVAFGLNRALLEES